jgi:ankyrin repeat protein
VERTPAIKEFLAALHAGDAARVRELLTAHDEVRAVINAPISWFDSPPVTRASKNIPLLDVLLEFGADINRKSSWWAGPFGILDTRLTPEEAAPLVARGAVVDVFAAANLGMLDRLRELVDAEPSLVHARGGDGKTPLHWAHTVEVAEFLVDRGADVDARDVDHESTATQYLIRESPDVVRFLIARGAWFDIYIAVALRDPVLVERCLRDDPEALDHRIWHGKYHVVHDGTRASTREEIGDHRGDIYRWVFEPNATAIDVASMLGFDDIAGLLLPRATPVQRLLHACAKGDRAAADAVVASHPDVVSTLTPDRQRLICDRAYDNDTAAVALMLDLGFDPLARGVDRWEPIRWAAFHGNPGMTRLLLAHNPPLGVRDPSYGGPPLGQCIYGSLHGWSRNNPTANYPETVRLLIEAGDPVDQSWLPTGRDDIDAVIRTFLDRHSGG